MTAVAPSITELDAIARRLRLDSIKMIAAANSGHPGGSLSAADIVTALYFGGVLKHDPKRPDWPDRDRFILSKGHGVPVLYAALAERGYFPTSELKTLRQVDSRLQGHPVQGLTPGAYFFGREHRTLEVLKEGEFRADAHHLGLEQELSADACVDIFFLADLKGILEQYGNRGYRAVQLDAGVIGGKIYLAAYAQHLGATGLTFFDDDVIAFFSPHAKDKSAIFLLAIGKPLKCKPQ